MDRDDWRSWDSEMEWEDPASSAPPDGFVASTYVPGVWPGANGEPPTWETRRMPRFTPPFEDERITAPTPAVSPSAAARGRTTGRFFAVAPPSAARGRTTGRIPVVPPAERQRATWEDAPTVRIPESLLPLPPLAQRDAPRAGLPARAGRDRDLRAFCEAPTGKGRALPKGIAIIPGSAPGSAQPAPRLRHHRRSFAGLGALVLAGVVLFAVTVHSVSAVSRPASFDSLAAAVGLPAGSSGPARMPNPGSAWQANVGVVPLLGGGGAAAPGVDAPGTAHLGLRVTPVPTVQPTPTAPRPAATAAPKPKAAVAAAKPASAPASKILPAPVHPWPPTNPWMAVPGHTPYAVSEPANDPYRVAFGQCTWWAQHERPDENLRGMGNARYWASGARARGYRVGTTPAVNATVVLQPGTQGAGDAGHVAHVMALYPGGWFLVSEMNAYGNGGGLGRVSFRYMHSGAGVQFIY